MANAAPILKEVGEGRGDRGRERIKAKVAMNLGGEIAQAVEERLTRWEGGGGVVGVIGVAGDIRGIEAELPGGRGIGEERTGASEANGFPWGGGGWEDGGDDADLAAGGDD